MNTSGKREHLELDTPPKNKRVDQRAPGNAHSLALRLSSNSPYCRRISAPLARITLLIIYLFCATPVTLAQDSDAHREKTWATGQAFQQARQRPFSISWQAAPLRDRIGQLARQQGISIFLDRRIDPRTPINLSASNVTMEQLLLQLCDQQNLGFCHVGDGFYFGSKQAANRLLISSANAPKLKRKTSAALLKKAASAWPDLTTPEEALQVLIAEADLDVENADFLPHDLMPSGSMPPMTLERRLRLLLIQFDLDYELKRNSKTLVLRQLSDLPATGAVRFSDVNLSLAEYQAIKSQVTSSRMRRSKNSISVSGPVEELVAVRDFIVRSFSPPSSSVGDQQFTLKVTNRRSAILSAIGKQLQLQVDTSLADPSAMAEVVSLSVTNVSLQELLDQIAAGSGTTCVVADGKIVVR